MDGIGGHDYRLHMNWCRVPSQKLARHWEVSTLFSGSVILGCRYLPEWDAYEYTFARGDMPARPGRGGMPQMVEIDWLAEPPRFRLDA